MSPDLTRADTIRHVGFSAGVAIAVTLGLLALLPPGPGIVGPLLTTIAVVAAALAWESVGHTARVTVRTRLVTVTEGEHTALILLGAAHFLALPVVDHALWRAVLVAFGAMWLVADGLAHDRKGSLL